jgi:hypothetical protein
MAEPEQEGMSNIESQMTKERRRSNNAGQQPIAMRKDDGQQRTCKRLILSARRGLRKAGKTVNVSTRLRF